MENNVRKRIERTNMIFCKDEELEKKITDLANKFVRKIIFDIGKNYDIVDLEPLIMGCVYSEFTSILLDESYKQMFKEHQIND
jgi:hypothetical protein